MQLITLAATTADVHTFVRFWRSLYQDPLEQLYENNIGLTSSAEALQALFTWKNGGRLSDRKRKTLEKNFLAQPELPRVEKEEELTQFILEPGGPIWRIFYLHCRAPETYPIFDQHVYRAMHWTCAGTLSEISARPKEIAESYVHEYLQFYRQLQRHGVSPRDLDKALWTFGKFLTSPYRAAVPSGPKD